MSEDAPVYGRLRCRWMVYTDRKYRVCVAPVEDDVCWLHIASSRAGAVRWARLHVGEPLIVERKE
jgi:hypothetical protein